MSNYEDGIPLADAALDLAPRSLRRQYEEALRVAKTLPLSLKPLEKVSPPNEPGVFGILTDLFELGRPMLPSLMASSVIRRKMFDALFDGLRRGKYLAFGYPLPRNPSDRARQVPTDLLELSNINWQNSSIKGAGLEFASVRIVRLQKLIAPPENFSDHLPTPSLTPGAQEKSPEHRRLPGRPSMRPLIEEAYRALNSAGIFRKESTKTSQADEIQKWISQKYPKTVVPKYEVIRRTISGFQLAKNPSSKL